MLAGIKEILVISTPRDIPLIRELLGTGEELGLKFSYEVQDKPKGISEAFLIGEKFIGNSPSALILGDNLFYGNQFPSLLNQAINQTVGASVFAYHVPNPESFGVVEFDANKKAKTIEEKPKEPKSNWAVTGLYFYDKTVCEKARRLKPSARGELEITDLNRMYMDEGTLNVIPMGRGIAWLDTGTHDALIESSQFVKTLESRQGIKIACIEEIAFAKNFISREQFQKIAETMPDSTYGQYVKKLASGKLPFA